VPPARLGTSGRRRRLRRLLNGQKTAASAWIRYAASILFVPAALTFEALMLLFAWGMWRKKWFKV
jgi:hypothetical protein